MGHPAQSQTAETSLIERVGGRIIDFDHHLYEPADTFTRHIDPRFRDLALVQRGEPYQRVWTMGDRPMTFTPPGLCCDVMFPPGFIAGLFEGKNDTAYFDDEDDGAAQLASPLLISDYPEWHEREPRVKLMDQQGLDAIVLLASAGFLLHHDFLDRPDALCANLRAYNRYLEDEWGYDGRGDGRVFAVPMLSLVDLDWAIEEVERVASLNSRFIWLQHFPVGGKSPADPTFDPFWARLQETGMKLVYHIGFEGFVHLYGSCWGENPHRNAMHYSAFQHYIGFGERPICDSLAALILHNLFGRFPGVEVISIENGSAWVPSLLRQLDKAAKMGAIGENLGGPLPELPSETFRQHVYVNPYHEEDLCGLVDIMGPDRVLFGSDYPHPEGLKHPLQKLPKIVEQLSPNAAQKFMYENAARLLGLG